GDGQKAFAVGGRSLFADAFHTTFDSFRVPRAELDRNGNNFIDWSREFFPRLQAETEKLYRAALNGPAEPSDERILESMRAQDVQTPVLLDGTNGAILMAIDRWYRGAVLLPAVAILATWATAEDEPPRGSDGGRSYSARVLGSEPGLRERLAKSATYELLRDKLHRARVDGRTLYVAEGDLLLDDDQLLFYAAEREMTRREHEDRRAARIGLVESPPRAHVGLVGLVEDGKLVRWKPGLTLTYCVLKKQFSSPERYRKALENMVKAAQDWQDACGVSFQHRPLLDEEDGTTPPPGTLFYLREATLGGGTVATSFFPGDPVERRRLLLDPSYFDPNSPFDPVGVLRHEIGHILGFRHEHIRIEAPPDCHGEPPEGSAGLTPYDPQSVMHYLCGGAGSRDLRLTQNDRLGAQLLYGPPLGA
ncbi:hypothetical protein HK102_011552, partial [Quaeritorhiza haematococci]